MGMECGMVPPTLKPSETLSILVYRWVCLVLVYCPRVGDGRNRLGHTDS